MLRRYLWMAPYILLSTLLAFFILQRPPPGHYPLLIIPVALAVVLHEFSGGLLAAGTALLGMYVAIQLHPGSAVRVEMWQQSWPTILALLASGPLAGWLTGQARERDRQRAKELEAVRNSALTAIHEAGREIAATLDLERTLRQVMEKAAQTLPMDAGILFRLDEDGRRYEVAVSHNLPAERVEKIWFAFDKGVPGWVVRKRKPLVVDDAREDSRVHPHVIGEGVLSVLATPLITRGRVVGVLNLFCQTGTDAFDEEALRLAQVFADQAAVFIENARLVDELRRAAAELEARVEERTRQLQETQAQVVRAEKMAVVGRLAASVAHEVNNPLQAIALHLQLLDEEPLSAAGAEQLAIVRHEQGRIAAIVQRLLDFQRPRKGDKKREDVVCLLQDVLALADKQLEQAEVDVQLDAPDGDLPVLAVGVQLQQVFLNLILNACEAMPDGGALPIIAGWANGNVIIKFSDEGTGMSAEVLEELFEPFFSTKHTGTGLGLAVSQEIVVDHGGEITAESPIRDSASRPGSRFQVTLPLYAEVELETFPVEAVIVDIRMPGMSGTDLLAAIRERWPDVAVVLLTGHGTLESAMRAVKEGAHDYLLKPAQPETIREVTAEALAAARRRRDRQQLLRTLRDGLQRLEALPGRPTTPSASHRAKRQLAVGDLHIDLQAHLVQQGGKEIELTPSEYEVLVTLAQHAGEVVDYVTLVKLALEYEAELWEAKELIKRHVFTLRRKIEPDPGEPRYVRNVRGVGYRLADPDA